MKARIQLKKVRNDFYMYLYRCSGREAWSKSAQNMIKMFVLVRCSFFFMLLIFTGSEDGGDCSHLARNTNNINNVSYINLLCATFFSPFVRCCCLCWCVVIVVPLFLCAHTHTHKPHLFWFCVAPLRLKTDSMKLWENTRAHSKE